MNVILGFVLHSLASIACVIAAMPEHITTVIGSGCENRMQFTTSFLTTSGDQCADCEFCSGSREAHIFDYKMDVCTECTSADADCDALEIVTSFDEAWTPTFFHLVSAAMDSTEDPSQITLLGSNDKTEWISLFTLDDTSSPLFPTRTTRETFSVFNSMSYKHYSLRLKRKKASTNMNIGAYGIVQDFLKKCSTKIFDDIIEIKPTDIVPIRGNKLTTISNPPNEFILSFKLYPRGLVSNWSSILRFTNTNNDCCNWPDRWLLIIFRPSSMTLHFVAGSTLNPNNYINSASGVQLHKWNNIEVRAEGDSIKLFINDFQKGILSNTNRPQLGKLDVYAGDKHYAPANAIIRDYDFTPLHVN